VVPAKRVTVGRAPVLFAAHFLVGADGLAVAIALPAVQDDLGLALERGQWVLTAYAITFGSLLLVGGRLADAHGARRVLALGLWTFAAGCGAAAAAPGFAALVAARALQGAGAAAAVPAALALAAHVYPAGPERVRALSRLAGMASGGVLTGLLFGGVVCDLLGWRAVFGLAAPAAALAAFAAARVPVAGRAGSRERGDAAGGVLVTAAMGLLVAAVTGTEHAGPLAPRVAVPGAAAAVLLTAFVRHERRAPRPLVPAALLRVRGLRIASLAAALNAGAFSGIVYVGTLHLQTRLGYRPLDAALAIAPLDAVSLLVGAVAGRLIARRSPRVACAAGFAATAAALAWLARTPADASYPLDLLPPLALLGVSLTCVFVVLTHAAMAHVPPAERGLASGIFETGTHLGGGAVAVAAYAALLAAGGHGAAFLGGAGLAAAGALLSPALRS
jgi:MFS family permease